MLAHGRRLLGESPDKLRLDLVDRQRFERFRAGRPIDVWPGLPKSPPQ
jgi:hypothetical protein